MRNIDLHRLEKHKISSQKALIEMTYLVNKMVKILDQFEKETKEPKK